MENALFIISHLVMLFCAVLVFYNSAEPETTKVKVTTKAFIADKIDEQLVKKVDDQKFITELELTPGLLQV